MTSLIHGISKKNYTNEVIYKTEAGPQTWKTESMVTKTGKQCG